MNIDWGFNGRGATTMLADGAGANFENKHEIPKCWVVGLEREAARKGVLILIALIEFSRSSSSVENM